MLRGSPVVRPGPPEVAAVLADLLFGEYPNPEDIAWLRGTHGVTAVVSLQDDADLASKHLALPDLEAAYRTHGVSFHRVPVADNHVTALAAALPGLVELLSALLGRGERVYLHCNAGMNRAPTVAIAYLHRIRSLPIAEARDLVKRCRPCVPYMQALDACYGTRRT
jgi:protein-tyrosine phosphatase